MMPCALCPAPTPPHPPYMTQSCAPAAHRSRKTKKRLRQDLKVKPCFKPHPDIRTSPLMMAARRWAGRGGAVDVPFSSARWRVDAPNPLCEAHGRCQQVLLWRPGLTWGFYPLPPGQPSARVWDPFVVLGTPVSRGQARRQISRAGPLGR